MTHESAAVDRAAALLDLDRPGEALRVLTSAGGADPAADELRVLALLALDRAPEAVLVATAMVGGRPAEAEPLRLLAHAHLADNRRKRAALAAWEAARIEPDNPDVLYTLSLCARWAGRPVEAYRAASLLVELTPDSTRSLIVFSQAYLAASDPLQAERAARAALERAPQDADALDALAGALDKQGRTSEAAALLAEVGRLRPSDVSVPVRIVSLVGKPWGVASMVLTLVGILQLVRLAAIVGPDGMTAVLLGLTAICCGYSLVDTRKAMRGLTPEARRGLRRERLSLLALLCVFGSLVTAAVVLPWSLVLLGRGVRDGTVVPLWLPVTVVLGWLAASTGLCVRFLQELAGFVPGAVAARWDQRRIRLPPSPWLPLGAAGAGATTPQEPGATSPAPDRN